MLPCKEGEKSQTATPSHFQNFFCSPDISGTARGLLVEGSSSSSSYCGRKHKVPCGPCNLFYVLTIFFGGLKIRQWKHWEDSIAEDKYEAQKVLVPKITQVLQHAFIKGHFLGLGKDYALMGWLHSFFKQFFGSVTKLDYVTLRHGFIQTHCKSNLKFNFYKYMIRALEDDFKQVVGKSWYLWIIVVIFLLLNINGWHTYFWIAFIPFFLLLAVGTKSEHVIIQLANEVAEKLAAIEGELVAKPSDDHFWFRRPLFILFLIHFILFQNSFEIAFFFWIWVTYGFDSCIMGQVCYIVPRLVIGSGIKQRTLKQRHKGLQQEKSQKFPMEIQTVNCFHGIQGSYLEELECVGIHVEQTQDLNVSAIINSNHSHNLYSATSVTKNSGYTVSVLTNLPMSSKPKHNHVLIDFVVASWSTLAFSISSTAVMLHNKRPTIAKKMQKASFLIGTFGFMGIM
ncbi:hypothetical protein K1719_022954 [Acacia pycnantha]|nr:hypothetical protein K1719_022954 [Acacia pycnantha]